METAFNNTGMNSWLILCAIHIVLSYIGARKLIKLDINPLAKIAWLLVIFFIPFAGIATFLFIKQNEREA
jgi:hypothetical protein